MESHDAVHRAIQGSSDLAEALEAALGVVLDVLEADRAWLIESQSDAWTPVMERTRPEYGGGLALGVRQPWTPEIARLHQRLVGSGWCVQFEPAQVASVVMPPGVVPPRAVLAMAIRPRLAAPWIFGLHQCSYARDWTPDEEHLFVEIGQRLAESLTSLIAHRDLRSIAEKLAQAGRVARLGYWERDVSTFEVEYSEGTYEIFGLSPGLQRLAPAELAKRLHPDDRHLMLEAYERAVAGGPRYDVDYRVLHPSGETRYVHSEADISYDADGRPRRMFGVLQDVTERMRLTREQEALRRVATLVARAATPEELFATVTEEVGRLLDVDLAVLVRYENGKETIEAGWTASGPLDGIGRDTPLGGRNISTLVHDTQRPARIDDYGEATGEIAAGRRAWGVRSGVGVPIVVEGNLRGMVFVASTRESPLPRDAEERLANFTELLGTAYANAEAREALRRVADQQAALRRVATLVARGTAPEAVFAAVAEEVGALLTGAESAVLGRYTADGAIEFVGAWGAVETSEWLGQEQLLGGHNVSTAVFETRRPARVDRLDPEASAVSTLARANGAHSSAGAPIEVEGRLWGVMIVASMRGSVLPHGIEHQLAAFTELIATAIANAEARAELTASRERLVTSADDTRRRIVRDLHDGAQSRLVNTVVTLELARRAQDLGDPAEARQLLDESLMQAKRANRELRELVQGILPSGLARWGLASAVDELLGQIRVPVRIDVTEERFRPEIEANAYFVIAEALTNVVKHAGAHHATVRAWTDEEHLYLEVGDDGVGGARTEGGGLRGLADRVEALGGRLAVDSPPGAGTRITATLPV